MIKSYTTPDGKVSITWDGDLDQKIELLAMLGIPYTPSADETQEVADIEQIRSEYIAAINRLQQIENAASPTNAQVVQAIKDIAKYERLILKLLRRMYDRE